MLRRAKCTAITGPVASATSKCDNLISSANTNTADAWGDRMTTRTFASALLSAILIAVFLNTVVSSAATPPTNVGITDFQAAWLAGATYIPVMS